jgi:hypothetical protein
MGVLPGAPLGAGQWRPWLLLVSSFRTSQVAVRKDEGLRGGMPNHG